MRCLETNDTTEIAELTAAIYRLAQVVEKSGLPGLGGLREPLYKPVPTMETDMVSEQAMATTLGIPVRTLGRYRRQGKLPNCWIKNGKRVRWRVPQTTEAWRKGIP